LELLFTKEGDLDQVKRLRHLIDSMLNALPYDNSSGSLMSAVHAIFKAKCLT
jgi:hypothetical protein